MFLAFPKNMNKILTLIFLAGLQLYSFGQNNPDSSSLQIHDTVRSQQILNEKFKTNRRVYKIKPASDIPITAIGTGWSLYAFSKIYSKDKSSVEKILSLDKNNIPSFDRRGADVYHPKADETGDMIFYYSMPLPV